MSFRIILRSIGLLLFAGVAAFTWFLFGVDHRPGLELETGDFFGLPADFEIQFKGHTKKSLFVTAEDGTPLAVDVFLPADGPVAQETFPVILFYGPYGRSHIYPPMTLVQRIGSKLKTGVFGPVFDKSAGKKTRIYLSQGYAYVAVDMRGTGASEGSQVPLDPILGTDGKLLVDWIAKQPWSNGKVCMEEQSYLGWAQFATAQYRPDALKCIMPSHIVFEAFTEGSRPGGIAAVRWLTEYSEYLAGVNSNDIARMIPTTPVIDEDGDGALKDEVPVRFDGDTPVYADHDERTQHHYARATLDHRDNQLVSEMLKDDYQSLDSVVTFAGRKIRFYDSSPGYYLKSIKGSGIAIYHVGGWFDGFVRGTTKLYATLQHDNPSKLFIAPRFHIPAEITPAHRDYFGYDGSYVDQLILESLRFFDHHLKGVDNGIDREKPIKLYTMHKGWREESEWPLVRQVMTPFYFGAGRTLSAEPGAQEGVDRYEVDWNHQADFGSRRTNRWILMDGPDHVMDRTEIDERTYYYETAPLEDDVEVTGHPIVNLWLSSNHADGDVFVYLTDVDAAGRSVYVTEGRLRIGWAELRDDDDQVLGAIDVKPDLPWHGYLADQYDATRMADGRVVHLTFDMEPTSWLFRKGHRIRVAIAGVDKDNFELNETVCPDRQIATCEDTVLSFYRTADMRSHIDLPVIPQGQ